MSVTHCFRFSYAMILSFGLIGVGAGCDALGGDVDRFLALINNTKVLGSTNSAFIFEQAEYAQCPSFNGGLFGDALQPDQCRNLEESRETTYTYGMLDAATLDMTEIQIPTSGTDSIKDDGHKLAWVNDDTDTLHTYDMDTGTLQSYLEGDARFPRASVVAVNGDYIALRTADENSVEIIAVYSISTGDVIGEYTSYGTNAAIEGEWLAYQRPSSSQADEIFPDFIDIVVVNLMSNEERTVAEEVEYVSFGPPLWGFDGRFYWTTGANLYTLHGYNIATDSIDFGREWDFSGFTGLDPILVLDFGSRGFLIAQHSSSDSDTVGYRLVPWADDEETVTLFEFDSNTESGPWYRNEELRFGGNDRVIWTDPHTGEFVVFDFTTGETQRFDPINR